MTNKHIYFNLLKAGALAATFLLFGCKKKSLEIEIIESACKGFTISDLEYNVIQDPTCGGNGNEVAVDISFSFDGEKDCLDSVILAPKFYESDNSELYPSFESQLGNMDFTLTENTVSFQLLATFDSEAEAANLNHLWVKQHTQNEIGNQSNPLEFRINGKCSTVDPSTYNSPKATYDVTSSQVPVRFWDDAAEDGDIISVYLNGEWVLENYTLSNEGEYFLFNVNSGDNTMVIFAINEGESGPNTLAVSIDDVKTDLAPSLLTGESINLRL